MFPAIPTGSRCFFPTPKVQLSGQCAQGEKLKHSFFGEGAKMMRDYAGRNIAHPCARSSLSILINNTSLLPPLIHLQLII